MVALKIDPVRQNSVVIFQCIMNDEGFCRCYCCCCCFHALDIRPFILVWYSTDFSFVLGGDGANAMDSITTHLKMAFH